MDIQWYPGHMTKARRAMEEDIKLIDLVIEVLDARTPLASKNPDIDRLAKNKLRLVLLNKSDMADAVVNKAWMEYYNSQGFFVCALDSRDSKNMRAVSEVLNKVCEEKFERDRKRGIKNRPVRAMVVGIPNVGKSTFINSFAKKAVAKTGNKPGVTKGKQWIKLNKSVELLDTPGILWPKFEDKNTGLKLAFIGSINDAIIDTVDLSLKLIDFLRNNYTGVVAERYAIDENLPDAEILDAIAMSRNLLIKGGKYDTDKAAAVVVDEFRSGKLGKITLEKPVLKEE